VLPAQTNRPADGKDKHNAIDKRRRNGIKQAGNHLAERPADIAPAPTGPGQGAWLRIVGQQVKERQQREETDLQGQDARPGEAQHNAELWQKQDHAQGQNTQRHHETSEAKELANGLRPAPGQGGIRREIQEGQQRDHPEDYQQHRRDFACARRQRVQKVAHPAPHCPDPLQVAAGGRPAPARRAGFSAGCAGQ